jgi:hypothetical protein
MEASMAQDRTTFWQEHLAAQASSGLTQAVYCNAHGLARKSFYNWKRRLLAPPSASSAVDWLPVAIAADPPVRPAGLTVRLPDGLAIDVPTDFSEAALLRLRAVVRR